MKQGAKSNVLLIAGLFYFALFIPVCVLAQENPPDIEYLSTIKSGVLTASRIAVDDSSIYVSDPRSQIVHAFDILGKPQSSIGRFAKPLGVALDRQGNIYVGNDSENSVSLFDPSGIFLLELGNGPGEFEMPASIAVDYVTDQVFVSDSEANQVHAYDSKGNYLFSITDLIFPTGIYVDNERRELLVADSGNSEIKVFDLSGNLLRSFGSSMNDGGMFGVIYGISADSAGRIYIADGYRNSVLVFNYDGKYIDEIGKGDLATPVDVAVDPFNRLLVSSYGGSSVVIYGIDGGDVSSALLSVNNKAFYTNSSSVDLNLICRSNNCVGMRFRNAGSSWSDWETFNNSKKWKLTVNEGSKTVYAEFEDTKGKITGHYAAITLDTTAPIGTLTIANGAESVTSTSVDLTVTAMDTITSVVSMRFSNDGITWSAWETFTEQKAWGLSTGYGTKTVSASLKDAAGNVSSDFSVSITVDSNTPVKETEQDGSDPSRIYDFKSVRTDGINSRNNLDPETNNPRIDLEYTFEITIKDQTGDAPEYTKLYMAQRSTLVDGDFYSYDMSCAGDWSKGAVCSYATKLGPASQHIYHFQTKLADGTVLRYPDTGEITGPTVELLNGGNLVGIPRNLLNIDASPGTKEAFGTLRAYRWVYDDNKNGKFEIVDKNHPVKPGEGYLIEREKEVSTMPLLDYFDDIEESQFIISLQPGWNIISNPYAGNVKLNDVKVKQDDKSAISWSEAVNLGILTNATYYYKGSDWGSAYSFESANADPDATLIPWVGYWIYLDNSSDTCDLVISKPPKG